MPHTKSHKIKINGGQEKPDHAIHFYNGLVYYVSFLNPKNKLFKFRFLFRVLFKNIFSGIKAIDVHSCVYILTFK